VWTEHGGPLPVYGCDDCGKTFLKTREFEKSSTENVMVILTLRKTKLNNYYYCIGIKCNYQVLKAH
jgi:hypothetical protein